MDGVFRRWKICFSFLNYRHYEMFYKKLKGLNMFFVPIKLGPFKCSPYLILMVFLVPIQKNCTKY